MAVIQEFQRIIANNTGIENITVECYSLTKSQKALTATIVALAALTALTGIVLLTGVGSIGTIAAWAMTGIGGGVVLLVSVPQIYRHHMFKKAIASALFSKGGPLAMLRTGGRITPLLCAGTVKQLASQAQRQPNETGYFDFGTIKVNWKQGTNLLVVYMNGREGMPQARIIFTINISIAQSIKNQINSF